ncbi:MAG: rhodanese-related sulfurtransferase [Candidatus Kapaibacterium sp.]
MPASKSYRVLLYYKYVRIDEPESYTALHLAFCKSLGVRGRILIASEGINGTISGTVDQTNAYMYALRMDPRFAATEFKIDEVDDHTFRKMHVRYRKEIVTMGLEDDIDPNAVTGRHLAPAEFHEALQRDDVIVIDARNTYEYDLGHFRNAIRPDVGTFKEFPQWVRENLSAYKDKTILTYCTGGIRCEKFSGFLVREGFSDVAQLHGGIVSYGKDAETRGRLFDGKCYVFDERVAVPINAEEERVISHCLHCGAISDRYVNCANLDCDTQFFCCQACELPNRRSCSEPCQSAERHDFSLEKIGEHYRFYR